MAGVYISYPFCSQKCTYCNFASGVFPRELETRYIEALRSEIARHQWAWTPQTVYIGGGTPSQASPADVAAILASIPGRPWREATIEAAPGTFDTQTIAAWADAGINRVSLGVQSFVQRELARTGRKHTAATVAAHVANLRACGITNINIDLIAGLPGQSLATWRESLEWIQRLEPPHVSVYMLEVDEDSRLGREVLFNGKRYGAPEVPSDAEIVDMYETASAMLGSIGIARYEISNFARPGFESLHNLKYWRLEPYAGFGADAHSFDGATRWQNVETASEYAAAASPRIASTPAQPDEKFFVGLRLTEGIRPNPAEWRRFEAPISRFVEQGLLQHSGGALRLTPAGILVSNEIFQEFIAIE